MDYIQHLHLYVFAASIGAVGMYVIKEKADKFTSKIDAELIKQLRKKIKLLENTVNLLEEVIEIHESKTS